MTTEDTFKPYIIEAFWRWCVDNEFTPLIDIQEYLSENIPQNLKDNSEFTLNLHPNSLKNLMFTDKSINFESLFNGKKNNVCVKYEHVSTIYCYENNYGLCFETEQPKKETQKLFLIVNNQDNKD